MKLSRPQCKDCESRMWLVRSSPAKARGGQILYFECPGCGAKAEKVLDLETKREGSLRFSEDVGS